MNNKDFSHDKNISFDEYKFTIKSRSILGSPKVPKVIDFLVKKRIVKNDKQALTLILFVIIILILGTIFFLRNSIHIEPALINPIFLQK